MKTINIALLGFGTVGSGTYKVLEKNKKKLQNKFGIKVDVVKILVQDKTKKRNIADIDNIITTDITEIINDNTIDIIVEAIGGINPAQDYMMMALESKKHVVTANKSALADMLITLIETAKSNNVKLKYEAAVGGAIPIVNTIQSALASNSFTEVSGILNGTSNYILSKMAEENMTYDKALAESQRLGFAEIDPSDDVLGYDSANKLSILIHLAFDTFIHPKNIKTTGIEKINLDDISCAQKRDEKIKLIASAKVKNGKVIASVKPMSISTTHPLYHTDNEYNAVYLKNDTFDELLLYGKGAGSLPTGNAIVSDIIKIAFTL